MNKRSNRQPAPFEFYFQALNGGSGGASFAFNWLVLSSRDDELKIRTVDYTEKHGHQRTIMVAYRGDYAGDEAVVRYMNEECIEPKASWEKIQGALAPPPPGL